MFDRAPQLHAAAAFGALENRRGVFHAGFELGFHAGLDFDLCDLGDHVGPLAVLNAPRVYAADTARSSPEDRSDGIVIRRSTTTSSSAAATMTPSFNALSNAETLNKAGAR